MVERLDRPLLFLEYGRIQADSEQKVVGIHVGKYARHLGLVAVRDGEMNVVHRDIFVKQRLGVDFHSYNPFGLLNGVFCCCCCAAVAFLDQLFKLVKFLEHHLVGLDLGIIIVRIETDLDGFDNVHQFGVLNHVAIVGRFVLVVLVGGF